MGFWDKMIKTPDFFWPGMPFVIFDDFCLIPEQLEIMLWVKMMRSLVYNLRTRWFYEWKLHDVLFKILTWNSLTFPLFRICLTFFQIPWQFPDLEKNNFSLTFPCRVATMKWIIMAVAADGLGPVCSEATLWCLKSIFILFLLQARQR